MAKRRVNLTDTGNLSGANTTNLVLTNILAAAAGDYSVVVSNSIGSVTSIVATLTILPTGPALDLTLDYGGRRSSKPAVWTGTHSPTGVTATRPRARPSPIRAAPTGSCRGAPPDPGSCGRRHLPGRRVNRGRRRRLCQRWHSYHWRDPFQTSHRRHCPVQETSAERRPIGYRHRGEHDHRRAHGRDGELRDLQRQRHLGSRLPH